MFAVFLALLGPVLGLWSSRFGPYSKQKAFCALWPQTTPPPSPGRWSDCAITSICRFAEYITFQMAQERQDEHDPCDGGRRQWQVYLIASPNCAGHLRVEIAPNLQATVRLHFDREALSVWRKLCPHVPNGVVVLLTHGFEGLLVLVRNAKRWRPNLTVPFGNVPFDKAPMRQIR